jgi:hypothetical protein
VAGFIESFATFTLVRFTIAVGERRKTGSSSSFLAECAPRLIEND